MRLRFRRELVDSFCFLSDIRDEVLWSLREKMVVLSKYEKNGGYGEQESNLVRIMVGLLDTVKDTVEADVCELFITASLRYNSHTIKFTLLKWKIHCFLEYSQNCAALPRRNSILINSHSPFLPPCNT